MNAAKKRPGPSGDQLAQNKRRSISTTSRDTSTAVNSPTEPDVRYAPINMESYQHPPHDQPAVVTPTDSQLSGEHASLAQIRQFNDSHSVPEDKNLQTPEDATQTVHDEEPHPRDDGVDAPNAFDPVNGPPATDVSFGAPQQRVLARTLSQEGAGGTGTDEEKKSRKQANNNAANEKELKELIETNAHRSLESIARDVRGAERTQKAEKAKQLFAMRWLKQYCKQDSESVPRSRVYTYYAQRCGTDRVDTLNPASFGKLVRIIFPGIQTRRLGVRGESKYHYVCLTLVEDPPNANGRPMSARLSVGPGDRGTPVEQEVSFQSSSRILADSAAFPPNDSSFPHADIDPGINPASQSQLFAEKLPGTNGAIKGSSAMYKQNLKFSQVDQSLLQDEPLRMPNIQDYLPPRTDIDLADALAALYRTHCTSLVDSVRFVKEKQFTKLLGSFNGTMTVPVQRLFAHASLAPWIRECDRIMYQQIIRFVSQLALQVIPPLVFSMLRTISLELTSHIERHFQQYPEHVTQAKLEMATVFSSLLQRLLRVNETAHAAANLLMNDDMRTVMWHDWIRSVSPKRVVESSLSRCGHEEAYRILTVEMRQLLGPLPPTDALEQGTEFASGELVDSGRDDWLANSGPSADTIIERWTMFLKSLPGRFPSVPTRTLLHCIESVGNASLRDVTVNVAQSFGAWWTTKVWVDEMMLWMAEMGGFLDASTQQMSSLSGNPEFGTMLTSTSRRQSADHGDLQQEERAAELPRPASANPTLDFHSLPNFSPKANGLRHSSGPPTATFQYPTPKGKKTSPVGLDFQDNHDDSGIGMSLLADGPPNLSFSPMSAEFGEYHR